MSLAERMERLSLQEVPKVSLVARSKGATTETEVAQEGKHSDPQYGSFV